MSRYEVWEGDHEKYVSSWNNLADAAQECDRLNNKYNRDYYLKKILDDGTELNPSRRPYPKTGGGM